MADIIAESGLSAGAIYLHYKNKHDLVEHVVTDVLATRGADLLGLTSAQPMPRPAAVVRTFVTSIVGELGGSGILVQVWALAAREPALAAVVGDFVAGLRRLYGEYYAAWFVAGGMAPDAASTRATAIAPLVVGLCQGYLLQSSVLPDFDAEQYLAAFDDLDFAAVPAR